MMIQIGSFLLHAQLRRFMMKGQKMLPYQHFQELMQQFLLTGRLAVVRRSR